MSVKSVAGAPRAKDECVVSVEITVVKNEVSVNF